MKPRAPNSADTLTIKNPSSWPGYSLAVEVRESIERPTAYPRLGVIRAFDLTSVFIDGRKMEHFASVEDLVKVWSVIRNRKPSA